MNSSFCRGLVKIFILALIVCSFCSFGQVASAGILTEGWDSFDLMPIRFISVKGDASKFRALNWMNDGTTGGIKNMFFDGDISKDNHLTFEGHGIPADNDYGAILKLTDSDGGFMTMDYGNFRKWYSVYAGHYGGFSGSSAISQSPIDPALDIGHFNFEVGKDVEDGLGLALAYDRNTRDGSKSMLQWGDVIQGVTRKIGYSWESIHETTDAVTLKGDLNVGGFNVEGKQKAEFVSGRIYRETLDGAPDNLVQDFNPYASSMVSSLKADRWLLNEKTYVGLNYQYQHLKNKTSQDMRVYNTTTGLTVSDGHNGFIDGEAAQDSHAFVQHFTTDLTSNLNFAIKLKEELISSIGSGLRDGGLGGSNREVESENKVTQTGQTVSLRYKGIPKASIYTDLDFQQEQNWTSKIRRVGGSSIYENQVSNPENTGVVGMRYVFNKFFNMASNYRYKSDLAHYDTYQNTDTGITLSRLDTTSNEFDNKFTWKPAKWLQNSVRVQLIDSIYRVQSLRQAVLVPTATSDWLKSQGNSRVYTYSTVYQPWEQWMFDVGYSLNNFKVSTPASQTSVSGGGIPVYEANVYTLLGSISYAPTDKFSVYTSGQYSKAKNFDSQGYSGIPYGITNSNYDVSVGAKWSPKKDLTFEPGYGYYSYNVDESIDYGSYSAHVGWLQVKLDW